jgi:hypothetical protein
MSDICFVGFRKGFGALGKAAVHSTFVTSYEETGEMREKNSMEREKNLLLSKKD